MKATKPIRLDRRGHSFDGVEAFLNEVVDSAWTVDWSSPRFRLYIFQKCCVLSVKMALDLDCPV